jgi:hypothetical protein
MFSKTTRLLPDPIPMRRDYSVILLLTAFCISTAILIWLILRIANEGVLSLNIRTMSGGTRFGATAVLLLAVTSAAFGYALISEWRDRLHERRLKKKINRNRQA